VTALGDRGGQKKRKAKREGKKGKEEKG